MCAIPALLNQKETALYEKDAGSCSSVDRVLSADGRIDLSSAHHLLSFLASVLSHLLLHYL